MTKPTDTELALIERQHAVTLDPEVRGRIVRDQMQPGDAEAFREFETARKRAKRRALHDAGIRWAIEALKARAELLKADMPRCSSAHVFSATYLDSLLGSSP